MDALEAGEMSDQSIEKYFAPKLIDKLGAAKLKGVFEDIRNNDRRLILYQADRKNMTEYKLIVKGTKSNEWMVMGFFFEDDSPYRIAGFTIDSTEGAYDSLKPIYPKSN